MSIAMTGLSKLKLNIGSGYKKFEGFINIDGDHHCQPDFVVNLDDRNLILPFDDDSVSEIIAHHILEHIGEGYIPLLREIYRVCEDGAMIDVRVPHHGHETYKNDPTHKRPITVEGWRLFSKRVNQHEIETGGTSSTLGIINDVDFEIVAFDFVHDSFYDQIKRINTPEQNERLFREALNTTLETHIVLTVVKQ